MVKQLVIAALGFFMVGQVSAKELTAQQALSRLVAGNASSKALAKASLAKAANQMNLVYTSSMSSQNTYYVFDNNQSGGYVILSADDNMPAVLGYVDAGHFDYNNIPANMKYYLKSLDATVRAYAKKGTAMKAVSGTDVSPLLGDTEWDQSTPYNNMCPVYEGGAKGKETALVGCVACAVAQVMHKWKYPTTGTGSRTYKFWWDTNKKKGDKEPTDSTELTSDFSSHTYDWSNMLDKYNDGQYNETQGKAVALLMSDVGIASKMVYGTDAAGGSGAETYDAGYGMVTYFGYDKSMNYTKHKFWTDEEWQQMTYNDLKDGRPVIFGGAGVDGSGGHEYVCDGFQASDGKFHINWGWSGSDNGYFILTGSGLVPEGSGSGGSSAGASYGYDQDALFHVVPTGQTGAGATGIEPDCLMATAGYSAKVDGTKLTLTGNFYNTALRSLTDKVGIKLTDVNNKQNVYTFTGDDVNLDINTSEDNINVTVKNVSAGEYTIMPMEINTNGAWIEMQVLSTFKAATLTVDENGNIEVTNNDAPKVEAQGAVKASKKSFSPATKNEDGTVNAETLVLTCEKGIKNCDANGQKLCFGCEFYDLTASTDDNDVYWLTDYAHTDAEEMAAGATIKTIEVEILPELEAGHEYEVNPIFYQAVDETLNDDAYWDKLDEIAQYVDLGDNEAPVIKIEGDNEKFSAVAVFENTDGTSKQQIKASVDKNYIVTVTLPEKDAAMYANKVTLTTTMNGVEGLGMKADETRTYSKTFTSTREEKIVLSDYLVNFYKFDGERDKHFTLKVGDVDPIVYTVTSGSNWVMATPDNVENAQKAWAEICKRIETTTVEKDQLTFAPKAGTYLVNNDEMWKVKDSKHTFTDAKNLYKNLVSFWNAVVYYKITATNHVEAAIAPKSSLTIGTTCVTVKDNSSISVTIDNDAHDAYVPSPFLVSIHKDVTQLLLDYPENSPELKNQFIKNVLGYIKTVDAAIVGKKNVTITVSFDEATAIQNVNADTSTSSAQADGKFIEDGRVVIVKNGMRYNTAGQRIK